MHRGRSWMFGGFMWLVLTSLAWSGSSPIMQQTAIQQADGSWQLRVTASKCIAIPETYTYEVKVPVMKDVTEEVDGKTVTKRVTVYETETKQATRVICKSVYEQMQIPLDVSKLNAFEVDGRKIPAADLEARISRRPLLVSLAPSTGKVPDYLASVFLPGTVVIIPPKPPTDMAPVALPMMHPAAPMPPQPATPQPAAPAPQTSRENPATPTVVPIAFAPMADKLLETGPKTPEPQLIFIGRDGADWLKIREIADVPSTIEVKMLHKSGATVNEWVTKAERVTRTTTSTLLPLKSITFTTPQGQPLPGERVKERLGTGDQPALLARNGGDVDPYWLQNVKPTVLVLSGFLLPEAPPPGFGQPAMAVPATMMPSRPAVPAPAEAAPPPPPATKP